MANEKMSDKDLEMKLLGNVAELQEKQRELMKLKAKNQANKKRVKVTDISKVPEKKVYSREAVYSVFVNKTGETTYFDGVQAESNIKYNDYIITFDHIMLPEDEVKD